MAQRGNTIHIPEGFYTRATLAKAVGVSPDTIKRWRQEGFLDYHEMPAGKVTVYLFGQDALKQARTLASGGGRLVDRSAA